jgi:excisionase family DNA binding protein
MEHYTLAVELNAPAAKAPDLADALLEGLAEYHPAVTRSDRGRVEVVLTLPAESIPQAVRSGLAVLAGVCRLQVVALEVMDTAEWDARLGVEHLPELVGVTEASLILGVSRQRVLQLVNAGTLPSSKAGDAVVIPRSAVVKRAAAAQ